MYYMYMYNTCTCIVKDKLRTCIYIQCIRICYQRCLVLYMYMYSENSFLVGARLVILYMYPMHMYNCSERLCYHNRYIDAVKPGAYGVPRPFYFIFQPSYWCGNITESKVKVSKILLR